MYFVLRRGKQNMSYKSQRSRSVPSVWECEDYQIIFVGCWRCFNGPEIRSEQFFFLFSRENGLILQNMATIPWFGALQALLPQPELF